MSYFPLGDYHYPPAPQYGWICPRCKTVHSPHSMSCWCSANQEFTITSQSDTVTITNDEKD